MFSSNLLSNLFSNRRASRRTRLSGRPSGRSLSARRLRVEGLEDRCLLSISGQVFNDLDSDGLKDGGEAGQSGWTIYLDADGNGQFDTGETSTTTAADGSYSFDGLAPGTYTVAEVQQPGWQQTSPVGTAPAIERVSLAADGTQANGDSSASYSLSADGRYVAFASAASNLVPDDTNGVSDLFVYDRQADTIERVSLAADGTQANDSSGAPSISADGRYVAFWSFASNLVPGDSNGLKDIFVTANPFASVPGSHVVALADAQDVTGIDFGNTSLATTRFYVVNDASQNQTYEYSANGELNASYGLNSGNTAPRGVATTSVGDRVWVVDANRKVYVYNSGGGLLGSWTAGSLPSNATVEDIAVGCEGSCIWIVDAKSDQAYHYSGAASRLSGSQNAGHSFRLNSGNANPKGIVVDGTYVWVVNDSTTDKVFKYTLLGNLVGSWAVDSANKSPTGLTIDPTGASQDIWIVDSGTDKVYQYSNARSRTSGSQAAAATFALAAGNSNPQGIADPPTPAVSRPSERRAVASLRPEAAAVDYLMWDLAYQSSGRRQPTKADHDLLLATYDPTMWL